MKRLMDREKILLCMLFAVCIGYLHYIYLLSPMLSRINDSKQSIDNFKEQLQEIEKIVATNEEYKKNYYLEMDKYSTYSEKMPFSFRDPEIANNLNELSKKSFSEMKSIDFALNTEPSTENPSVIPITVNANFISADYESAINLVKSIETDTRIVNVKSLSLASASDQVSDSTGILVNLGLEFYYMKSNTANSVEYNFNNGLYGKADIFK